MANTKTREDVGDRELGHRSTATREVLRRYHDAFRNHRLDDLVASDDRELTLASGSVCGMTERTPWISQNAAVWKTSRT